MKKTMWLSYDLGVQGDYESLYAWLDEHAAKECGDSVAHLEYNYEGDFIESLKKDLAARVALKNSRIYVVHRDGERMKGTFLFGKRKAAPWTGYGPSEQEEEEDF